MKIYYDTEFLEDGYTIEPISIGMVAEDGRELYAVNRQAPWNRVLNHPWLRENVVPSLPHVVDEDLDPDFIVMKLTDPVMHSRREIRDLVQAFLFAGDSTPELWAWCGAYDHVVLAQLFGRMIDLPAGVPHWTNDLAQEHARLGRPEMPEQPEGKHNALADARHLRDSSAWLRRYEIECEIAKQNEWAVS